MTEPTNNLIESLWLAAEDADRHLRTRHELESLIRQDDFGPAGRVHDWRNHISDAVAESWASLSLESRVVAFIAAASAAHSEQWD